MARPGHPTHKPSEINKRLVTALCSVGATREAIARIIHVSPHTLRKAYKFELDEGLSYAVGAAAANMFRLALKQSSTGFMAARHVLRCFGGPAWRESATVNLNPSADLMLACGVDTDNARAIIAAKLDALAVRNAALDSPSESSH